MDLKILILEDVQLDAELMEYEMQREGVSFISRRVETEEGFIRELENFLPDIILVDHSLPQFDGVTALEIVKNKTPDTPFIFVSGKIGDEFAVDVLKKGATDFIEKPAELEELLKKIELAHSKKMEVFEQELKKKISDITKKRGW